MNAIQGTFLDIVDESTASGTLDTIGELIRDLKRQGHIIHFSISGGRRLMAFLSFSAALLYFDTPDELLHLYTPESAKIDIDYDNVMHVPSDHGQRLIEVPFARAVQPLLSSVLNRSPSATLRTQREQREKEKEERCAQVQMILKGRKLKRSWMAERRSLAPSGYDANCEWISVATRLDRLFLLF